MAELKSHLVLVDEEGEYVDDTGGVHPLDPESAREQSRLLLGEIAQTLGEYKKTSQGVKKEKSHSFGGHDLIKHIYDLAFVIPASGLTIEIFKLARKWMDVLKTRAHRTIVLVIETKDRIIRVEVSGDNAEDMYKNAVERLKGLASPE